MDVSNVEEQMHDLTAKLVSLEPVEYNSAINNYFDAQCTLQQGLLQLHGASHIKKVFALDQALAVDTQLVDPQPTWDADNQVIKFTVKRSLGLPWVPPFVPFQGYLRGVRTSYTSPIELHLFSPTSETRPASRAGDGTDNDDGKKYYVTKFVAAPSAVRLPLVNLVPGFVWHLLAPLYTMAVLALATTISFFHQYPYRQYGLFGTVRAILYEIAAATIAWTHAKISGAIAAMERNRELSKLKDGAGDAEFIKYAQESIQTLQANLRSQGSRAAQGADGLRQRFNDMKSKAAAEISQTTQDDGEAPQTPGGGTNPRAPGAPSYAGAVAQHPDNELQWSRE